MGEHPEDTARDYLLLGSRVVLNMLDCIKKPETHCVYFDNFFTSRDLLIHLRNLGFRATGTVRENRVGDCPLLSSNALKKIVLGNYDYQFDKKGEVLFVRWHDNRCVTIGSNFDKVESLRATIRYSRQASKKTQVQQPAILKLYNAYMRGVDHHDWLVGKYTTIIRGKRWYWVLFTRMLDMALKYCYSSILEIGHWKTEYYTSNGIPIKSVENDTDIRFDGICHMTDERRRVRAKWNGKPKTYCVKCRVTLLINSIDLNTV
ncbi:piggyBac transposable element-derived protein 3-like [Schistocerca gregaria]|uniref:piggyBac transposable element-derived protein 3-like n=1 Tax=Schistocerca gregaria TaxID=7010 RepID=UPI00211ED106|nr:piggyBac transposable element-derived protein 3-like [Schistocerca gregaria]